MTTEQVRTARIKDDQVGHLMRKTVENGATPGEEVSAIQLAHMIVRQRGLDLDAFKAALAEIGNPPRYAITEDGFLVPVEAVRTSEAQGSGPRHGAAADELCRTSPTGYHRMEKYMRGTVATGVLYCIHCGIRR